jgi:Tfp pilus assembly protein PilO
MPKEQQPMEECVAMPVQLKVAGNYFQLLDFLQRLRGEERFYQLRQMKVRNLGEGGKLEVDILLVMFAENI